LDQLGYDRVGFTVPYVSERLKGMGQGFRIWATPWPTDRADDFFGKHDLHVHVPAGSIPKDGPSAGITIGTAILSVLTAKPVNRRVAMTGEITLRGDVLPIGGLKEKVLAAKLAGIHTMIVPKLNRRDLTEIPVTITEGLTFHFVDHMDDVLKLALIDETPAAEATAATGAPAGVDSEPAQTAVV